MHLRQVSAKLINYILFIAVDMLTRSRRTQVHELIEAFCHERLLHQRPSATESSEADARQVRLRERSAIREKNQWSLRRRLRPGEVRRIVELRFG